MGAIAERLAGQGVVTDDNPRHETPSSITHEIVSGMRSAPTVINDSVQAIGYAIASAGPRDWVLVAGQGHEDTQQVGDEYFPMDDRSVVGRCLGLAA